MTAIVRWRLFLRVRNRATAYRLLDREVLPCLRDGRLVSDGRYWKIPELWECVFEQQFPWLSDSHVVYDVLRTADRLGTGWCVTGPGDDGPWHFDGVLASRASGTPRFAGLDWAHFDVTLDPPADEPKSAAAPPSP